MSRISSWLDSLRRRLRSPAVSRQPRRPFRPGVEALEGREVPTVFTVTSTLDSGAGWLRAAILSADTHANDPGDVDRIAFNIAGAGVHTIRPNSALPTINDAVVLDGFTQPGARPNARAVGDDSLHLIEVRGDAAGLGADGLTVTAAGVTVRGLVINAFRRNGNQGGNGLVVVAGGVSAVLAGNFLGTNAAGTQAVPNENRGVLVSGNPGGVRVGGPGAADRNVIAGNGVEGIRLDGSSGNVVQNNYVGTDAAGTADLGNGDDGVFLFSGSNNNIFRGNVLSGNGDDGIEAQGSTSGNLIAGNLIGLNAAGTAALGNRLDGVRLFDRSSNNTVGGPGAADRNVISGNGDVGVSITSATSTGNVVQGNFIGTDVTGTRAVGNGGGIFLDGPINTTIRGNVISGNEGQGISTFFSAATGVRILGNKIGTNAAGTAPLGNGGSGVKIDNGAAGAVGVEIGSAVPGEGNLISGNVENGVFIEGPNTTQVTLFGNKIGTDVTGTLDFGNGGDGVHVEGGATGVVIGADDPAARNVIAGSGLSGIFIEATDGVLVINNFVGVNAAGTAALANAENGVFVEDSDDAVIRGNVLSGNGQDGIELRGTGTDDAVVVGNKIGTNAAGTAALGNGGNGIELARGPDNIRVGGSAGAERNVISGNARDGILIGIGSFDLAVLGNFIGTDVTGTLALGNGGNGVEFTGGASNNFVGDTVSGAGNTIAFNGGAGVAIVAGDGNAIFGNRIFGNGGLAIDLGDGFTADGPTPNDAGDADLGANDLQNAPVLDAVSAGANGAATTVLHGTLNSTAGESFHVEFFASAAAGAGGTGQGQRFLGSVEVIANAAGSADFTFTVNEALPDGSFVSATASADPDSFGFSTSEFSNALRVGGETPAPPAPVPTPPPAPAPRGIVAFLQQVKQKGKKSVLRVVVLFADTGEVKAVFRSPFQKPAFQKIKLSTLDTNGDGAADTVRLTARRNGKSRVRLLPV